MGTVALPSESTTVNDAAKKTSRDAESPSMLSKLVNAFRAVLPMSALLLAAALISISNQFYENLGIHPSDVGLGFDAKVLTSSPGMVLLGLLILGYVAGLVLFLLARRPGIEQPHKRMRDFLEELEEWFSKPAAKAFVLTALSIGLIIIVVQFYGILQTNAAREARLVRQGESVVPYRFLGFVIIPIRAEPAYVDWIRESDATPIAKKLKDRPLMYLGRANGMIVLYDYLDQEAIFVQESSVVLRVTNCEVPNERAGCY